MGRMRTSDIQCSQRFGKQSLSVEAALVDVTFDRGSESDVKWGPSAGCPLSRHAAQAELSGQAHSRQGRDSASILDLYWGECRGEYESVAKRYRAMHCRCIPMSTDDEERGSVPQISLTSLISFRMRIKTIQD